MKTTQERLSEMVTAERAAGREPHALVSEIIAGLAEPASDLRGMADRLCEVQVTDPLASALRSAANYAARAEYFRRAGKAQPMTTSVEEFERGCRRGPRKADEMRTVRQILEAAGYETRAYSGRGMYGKECLAMDTDADIGNVMADVLDVIEPHENADMAEAFRKMRQDALGKGTIVYFPRIAFEA